ncbi:TIGR00282 family metallophosphoesterase [Caldinitratiruptor microaerophilus]|uniref:2',3'-cyclic-nucleotide 2'-phosphodiesterase n=1 Tax=Caldinitratiruptor microaerophilus TaxID=671077 RepID=A0AA35CIX2_9FIRM|nr:TIGR00282 family metallophosphoesterase [Caldinitratiruptor microaerophilus]BDG59987.1 2',3'-cyclic-nucleotide 2'-phosphodiesterase [Caldinitratiruptor microaerophilus]
MNILFFGDVVGKAGRQFLARRLGPLRREHGADLVVVNGENAAAGAGITPAVTQELLRLGVDVVTLGNHAWDRRDIQTYIDSEPRLLRPLNLPAGTPGFGSAVVNTAAGRAAVVCLHGRVFFPFHPDDPFRVVQSEVERLREITPVIVVDFHGEATSEKAALGYFLDGKVSAVVGTHTHVQTADERILPGGTAYITDVGMCGPQHSVIGMDVEQALQRFLTQLPVRLEVARGPAVLSAVVITVDPGTGKALGIRRILEHEQPDDPDNSD